MQRDQTTLLRPLAPYDFRHTLSYFSRRAGELVDRVEGGAYRRLFWYGEAPLLAELRDAGDGALALRCRRTDDPATELPAGAADVIAGRLSHALGLRDDLAPFRAAAAGDPVLAALVDRYAGLRVIATQSPFEALVWAVIGQQISLHVAFRLKAALVRRYGRAAPAGAPEAFDGGPYVDFPAPAVLACADADELAALGLGRRKAATIVEIARRIESGDLDLHALAPLPLNDALSVLTAIKGVGPWTAQYTLLRGLRRVDACPFSDGGLLQAAGRAYGLGRKATPAEVQALAARWQPFAGYAAFYLWYSLAEAAQRPMNVEHEPVADVR